MGIFDENCPFRPAKGMARLDILPIRARIRKGRKRRQKGVDSTQRGARPKRAATFCPRSGQIQVFIEEMKSTRCAIRNRGAPLARAGGVECIPIIAFGRPRSLGLYIARA